MFGFKILPHKIVDVTISTTRLLNLDITRTNFMREIIFSQRSPGNSREANSLTFGNRSADLFFRGGGGRVRMARTYKGGAGRPTMTKRSAGAKTTNTAGAQKS